MSYLFVVVSPDWAVAVSATDAHFRLVFLGRTVRMHVSI